MTITTSPVFREFTREQSTAIARLHVEQGCHTTGEPGFVEVTFQSNIEKAYGFDADPTFCEDLIEIISCPDLKEVSLGRLIAQARRNGNLTVIEQAD